MAEDDDWEPAQIHPRSTQWKNAWTPIDPGGAHAGAESHDDVRPADLVPEAQPRGISLGNILIGLATVLLGVAWWGALGVDVLFVYLTPSPMLDSIVLSVAGIAWAAFVWRLLSRPSR